MPNWCYNELTLSIREQDANERSLAVLEALQDHNPFQKIYPCPAELDTDGAHTWGGENPQKYDDIRTKLRHKYGYDNGYDWRVENWGTKWDIEVDVLDRLNLAHGFYSVRIAFDSAWSPPESLYRYINQKFPDIEIVCTAEEPGVGFMVDGYFLGNHQRWDVSDYVYEEEAFDLPDTAATPNVGAATILPLPKGVSNE